ncbi:hypothetical protein ANCCAN_24525 [Ancylostoma caninum]|uniref:Uncharacterized protein n=1 Tax=Ancylostoma caninum TaxID=29170 RepID=A0A368FC36_ANCCA|nr:hypothetical protein ANCCAN_24525 [Ancylostoma caninum]
MENTMNATIHIWIDVWECANKKNRRRDLLVTIAGLIPVTALFYASCYMQGGGQTRTLIRYSRMAPQGQRSRLLSYSASDNNISVYSVSGTS